MAPVKVPQPKVRSRKDGAAIPLDETDKRLMNLLQSRFPLDPAPFAAIAAEAEISLDDTLERTQRLLDGRIIREITPIFDTRALGYDSMLVAAKVDAENPHRAAKIINSHPGVSHNYLRTHEFNLWFTIATPPDSELGLQGTLATPAAAHRRRVDPPAADPEAVQDQHEPRDGEGHRRACRGRRGGDSSRARGAALRRVRHRRDPRPPGPDGGRSSVPTTPPQPRSASRSTSSSPISREWSSARSCAASPRSSITAAPASRPTGWGSGGFPRRRSSRSAPGWPRCAGSRTATSAPPTPTGPTRCSRWPTAARRRSATRSSQSIADEHDLHGDDRAILYSSTEFKKIRLRYFTDEYADWEREHAAADDAAPRRSSSPAPSVCCPAASTRRSARCARSAASTRSSSSAARASSSSTSTVTATSTGSAHGAR